MCLRTAIRMSRLSSEGVDYVIWLAARASRHRMEGTGLFWDPAERTRKNLGACGTKEKFPEH